MKKTLRLLSVPATALLLSACANQGGFGSEKATAEQQQAIQEVRNAYEAGRYKEVTETVGISLPLQSSTREINIEALKLQAFSYCLLKDTRRCERSFARILVRYPDFELSASESQHPMWAPAYERAKAGRK